MNKNWYAVYTKALCEKKVASLLTKKKIENFCPINRTISGTPNYRRRIMYEPLFPSFVFVYITPAEMNFVRQTNDVINFVYWIGKPAVIKAVEIENIHSIVNAYYNIRIEKTAVNPGGTLRISEENGINMDMGIVSSTITKITLPSLGYVLITETGKSTVEFINSGLENSNALI